MRARFCVLTLLALLLTPAELRAQLPSAIAHEAPCAAAPADTWSEAEKFVWTRVCAGEIADFNALADSGGELDARSAPFPDQRILGSAFIHTITTNRAYRDAITPRGVRVFGARFTEPINLANVAFTSELWFENCVFEKDVDLSWLQAAQPLGFNKSKLAGKLTLYAAQISGDLQVISSVIDRLDLSGARISRTADLRNSHVTGGDVEMAGLEVGADLKMTDGEYKGINLLGAHIGHSLNLVRAKVTGALRMDSLQVGVYLHFQNATLGSVDLLGARVQNQVSFQHATVAGPLQMFDMQVGTDLWMNDAEFSGPVSLRSSQVGGHLSWNKSTFHQDVDLSAARIGGELQLGSAKWGDKRTLTARYTYIGVLPSLSASWPPKLHVFGMAYGGLADTAGDFHAWFARQDRYSRQPYEQLAGVLHARGEIERATEVRVAERDRDRSEQHGVIFAWLTLLKYLIGYGYYPYYSIYWVAGLVVLGALVLRFSGEGPRNKMPIGLSYSFDMLLPVIRLREEHYKIDLVGRARYYFYFHRIMGWALASFLVAGLSGLTK